MAFGGGMLALWPGWSLGEWGAGEVGGWVGSWSQGGQGAHFAFVAHQELHGGGGGGTANTSRQQPAHLHAGRFTAWSAQDWMSRNSAHVNPPHGLTQVGPKEATGGDCASTMRVKVYTVCIAHPLGP